MNQTLNASLTSLFSWLRAWESEGGFNGYIIHRYNGRRLSLNNPTCWAQGPICCGLLNLCKKDQNYENLLKNALTYQMTLLDPQSGKYRYCGHEDDRFSSLIHCALANEALLEGYQYFYIYDETYASSLLNCVEKNINNYLLTLWNEKYGAFKFNDVDFYSKHSERFVANMNITFIYTLILFSKITSTNKYEMYIEKTLSWFFQQQISSDNIYLDGGFTYQQEENKGKNLQNPVVIYNGIIAEYMSKIYTIRPDSRLLGAIKKVKNYLYSNYDPETKLFFHDYVNDKLLKYPLFVAGSAFILKGLHSMEQVLQKGDTKYIDITKEIIQTYQYAHGGFPGFIGYNHSDNGRNNLFNHCETWEDIAPTTNWNGKMFEYLSTIASLEKSIHVAPSLHKIRWNYFYREAPKNVLIVSWFPIKSIAVLFYKKIKIKPIFSFNIIDFYKKIKP